MADPTLSLERFSKSGLRFDNAFARELPADPESGWWPRQVPGAAYSRVLPTPVPSPQLVAYSPEMAAQLGLHPEDVASPSFAQVFAGNALLEGMDPFAANYGGHQFGAWAGQLGDGRAITLGEALDPSGGRWELQLKGAGRTPYSRSGDGRAVLRSSVREFLCSEAMHHLGVPTTRALSLVLTGEKVMRDMFYDGRAALEPGAIVCRVSPSFIRFGTFELPASRGEMTLLERLVDFTIRRDYAALLAGREIDEAVRAEWFGEICARTARTLAAWTRVGFVHGVMNTDNMSILGLTIDYGPYGWIDDFDPDWTPNTTDAAGRRYRFGTQPQIAYWNLGRLAYALAPLFGSADPLNAGLQRYLEEYAAAERHAAAAKLGLPEPLAEEDVPLMRDVYGLLREAEVDMTLFFRGLVDVPLDAPDLAPLRGAFYDEEKMRRAEPAFAAWLSRHAARVRRRPFDPAERRARMHAANPKYVLRNYLAQLAIDRAEEGDYAGVAELLDVMRHPYEEQPGRDAYAQRRPDWARDRPGCSMLSCSS